MRIKTEMFFTLKNADYRESNSNLLLNSIVYKRLF